MISFKPQTFQKHSLNSTTPPYCEKRVFWKGQSSLMVLNWASMVTSACGLLLNLARILIFITRHKGILYVFPN
jgi:hypothetical protein